MKRCALLLFFYFLFFMNPNKGAGTQENPYRAHIYVGREVHTSEKSSIPKVRSRVGYQIPTEQPLVLGSTVILPHGVSLWCLILMGIVACGQANLFYTVQMHNPTSLQISFLWTKIRLRPWASRTYIRIVPVRTA